MIGNGLESIGDDADEEDRDWREKSEERSGVAVMKSDVRNERRWLGSVGNSPRVVGDVARGCQCRRR